MKKCLTCAALSACLIANPGAAAAFSITVSQPYAHDFDGISIPEKKAEFVLCETCAAKSVPVIRPPKMQLSLTDMQKIAVLVPGKKPEKPAEAVIKPAIVHFPFAKAVLPKGEQAKLDTAADQLVGKNVAVTGYTDKVGSKKGNDRLAKKRAKAVADRLKQKQVKVVSAEGRGKCCYVSNDDAMNRRVEITPVAPGKKE